MENQIIFGAGKFQRLSGWQHHDQIKFDGIDVCFDLNLKSWPINPNTYKRVLCFHVIEHLNSLINFMDNCWELLDKGGVLEIETPNAGINFDLTHCDPTHVRAYRPHSFINYFTRDGVEKFHYTERAWEMSVETFQLEIPNDCIRVIATPIK